MQSTNGPDLNSKQQQPPQQQSGQQQQQRPQWVPNQWIGAMQYPAAAMVMMQQQQMMMMYPHLYMPYSTHHFQYQQQYQQQQQKQQQKQSYLRKQQQGSDTDEVKTIWVGDLLHWMDETYLHGFFSQTGEVSSVKIIRNKQTRQSEGYGFVEFCSRTTAEKVLQNYNDGSLMPQAEQSFRLNWASFSVNERRSNASSELSIFVGDLAADVTDTILHEAFSSRFQSVKEAKVVIDSNTGRSKGYGFVRFGDENEKSRAMTEMNGVYCSSRPMRIGVATPKKASGYQQQNYSQGGHASNGAITQGPCSDHDSNNATIFVGGLNSDVSDNDLRQPFSQFGEIISVKIPPGKGCGFVLFANRKDAEEAIQNLNGITIGKQTVRLSWGRNMGNKQWRADSGNQWNGGYYRRQGYGGYGYGYGYATTPNQDPSIYAATAAAVPSAS